MRPSQAEAEAKVAKKCSEYGRGARKVVSFSGGECVGLSLDRDVVGKLRRRAAKHLLNTLVIHRTLLTCREVGLSGRMEEAQCYRF